MIIGTAGHIDHGKTALVQALTGTNADRLAEEKKRGITIDLGYAYMPVTDDATVGFIDVPGHERFVHNMLAGATGIDLALLVIAANDGIKPQTIEHLQIIDLLGIEHGIVALTKADLADAELRALRTAEVQVLLAKTKLADAPIMPVSSVTDEGIDDLKHLIAGYGRSLKQPSGHPRLAIDRAFTLQGTGLVVTGTLFAGEISIGDRLILTPKGLEVRVRGIHAQNRAVETAVAGERCALNITGARLSKDVVVRGDWIVADDLHRPTSIMDVRLKLLGSEKKPLRHWTPVHVHLAASHTMGRVALLEGDRLEPGGEAFAQLVLDVPVGTLSHDRIVVRDQSAQTTMAGATVVDPFASARNRRKADRLIRLRDMMAVAPKAATAMLSRPPGYIEQKSFTTSYNLTAAEAAHLWQETAAIVAGPLIFGNNAWIEARQTLISTLAGHHNKAPEHPGLQPERLRTAMEMRLSKEAFAEVLAAELNLGGVVVDGPWLRLPTHTVSLSMENERQWRRIEQIIMEHRFRPPRVRDFAGTLDVPEDDVRTLMRRVARLGRVIEVAHDHFFLRATVAEMIQIAAEISTADPTSEITAAAFRDRIDSGRKVAIQILEFFDKHGITIRRGDRRKLRPDRLTYFGQVA